MNKRDIYNIAILKLFNSQRISESQAFSMMKLDSKKSDRTRNKYIKKLIKWIKDEQLYLEQEKLHGASNEENTKEETSTQGNI